MLLGIPVKNCAAFLPNLVTQILGLDWQADRLRVIFLENDSDDDSYEACLCATDVLRYHGISSSTVQKSFGYHLPHESRHLPEVQRDRLRILGRLRQLIVDHYLQSAEYLFWVDADFERIPSNSLKMLVGAHKDIIIPVYRTAEDGSIYDCSSFALNDDSVRLTVHELLEHTGSDDIVPMHLLNAAALVHRRVFNSLKDAYIGAEGNQEGSVFSKAAITAGFSLWLHKKVCIQHACISGEEPLEESKSIISSRDSNIDPGFHQVITKLDLARITNPARIHYMVYAHSTQHDSLCYAQYHTWGRQSSDIAFYSNECHPDLPTIAITHGRRESYENLWSKVIAMLQYAYTHHIDKYDWFMFGGTDLLVITENVNLLLETPEIRSKHDRQVPLYLGRRLRLPGCGTVFNSGGSGYILNRYAIDVLVGQIPFLEPGPEDVMIAKGLARQGIYPEDTRDQGGAERFHPLDPVGALNYPRSWPDDWFCQYTREFDRLPGIDGISDESVSFHYMDEISMPRFWRQLIASKYSKQYGKFPTDFDV